MANLELAAHCPGVSSDAAVRFAACSIAKFNKRQTTGNRAERNKTIGRQKLNGTCCRDCRRRCRNAIKKTCQANISSLSIGAIKSEATFWSRARSSVWHHLATSFILALFNRPVNSIQARADGGYEPENAKQLVQINLSSVKQPSYIVHGAKHQHQTRSHLEPQNERQNQKLGADS